jgi:hypothetical protein
MDSRLPLLQRREREARIGMTGRIHPPAIRHACQFQNEFPLLRRQVDPPKRALNFLPVGGVPKIEGNILRP